MAAPSVRAVRDPADLRRATLTWAAAGGSEFYVVRYGVAPHRGGGGGASPSPPSGPPYVMLSSPPSRIEVSTSQMKVAADRDQWRRWLDGQVAKGGASSQRSAGAVSKRGPPTLHPSNDYAVGSQKHALWLDRQLRVEAAARVEAAVAPLQPERRTIRVGYDGRAHEPSQSG